MTVRLGAFVGDLAGPPKFEAQVQFRNQMIGDALEQQRLVRSQGARTVVEHAQAAEDLPVGGPKWHGGMEGKLRRVLWVNQVVEDLHAADIAGLQEPVVKHTFEPKGKFPRCVCQVHSARGGDAQAGFGDQQDQTDGRTDGSGCERGGTGVTGLSLVFEHPVAAQRGETVWVGGQQRRGGFQRHVKFPESCWI